MIRRLAFVVAAAVGGWSAAGVAADVRFRPRFALEQITQVPTLGQWTISRDGTQVAYTVVGYYFGFPVIPRLGEANNIRVVSLETGEILQLTTGVEQKTEPRFSPQGDRVAFESGDDIWVAEVASGRAWRVTIDLASDRDAAWSPDGRRLAFVSNRGGSAEVWTASVEGERHGLTQVTRDAASEADPDWSPDGQRIAYTATRGTEHFYASGVYVVPAAGGSPVRVTPADVTTNLGARWSPDGRRLAILSDRSGYVHVWTMAPDGSQAREFDTGPRDSVSPHFQVRPVWSRDGSKLQVSVNREGSFDLAVLEEATGRVEVAAGGGGQYHEVGWSKSGELVYAHENAWSPPDLYVREPGAGNVRQLTFSSHAAFRPEHFATARRVEIKSLDGFPIHGFLLTPTGLQPGQRLPAIVNFHTNSYGQFYDHWGPFFQYLVQSGYAMLMVDHRGSAGYGRKFREAGIGTWGTQTLGDVKAAAAFLQSQAFVDPERVGAMGLSNGAYMTLIGLTKAPGLFRAGVELMGATDRHPPFLDRNRLFHIGTTPEKDPDLYNRISPITSVEDMTAPIFIIHSDGDRNVAPGLSYNFVDELERRGKPYEVAYYPDEAHGLADPAHQLDSYRRIVSFFDRHLKTAPASASPARSEATH
jgi:dipeptidyl aminopeptidase/acylaminoacyl peptidase